ncbi:MAG: phosphopyruvate hydratase [Candidatus Dependentiae bacterium]
MKIEQIVATEIFDSRGEPTIACTVILQDGSYASSSVPTGRSKSSFSAVELRDGGTRLGGLGVHKAIANIHDIIAPALIGHAPSVVEMDMKMVALDGTEDKSTLGANAMLAVSIAVLKAQAMVEDLELYELIAHLCDFERVSLPFAMFNLINGGVHAHNNIPIQECMIMPVGVESFRSSIEVAAAIFQKTAEILKKRKLFFAVGDEGGYSAPFNNEIEALDLVMQALKELGVEQQVVLALDIAATQLYDPKTAMYNFGDKKYNAQELIDYYDKLSKQYPLYSIEDGLTETDWQGWKKMTEQLGDRLQIVGDDLFATNPARIVYGIESNAANAVIIKPNQVGTVTEALQSVKLCKDHDMNVIVSHRSGETNDNFIVDLAVGSSAGQIKAGGLMRGERIGKYNKLLCVEEELMDAMLGF